MPFAEINGIDLYYEIQGNGEPVLLLHHGFGCSKMWDNVVQGLVDQGYKTVVYDRKGFGQSKYECFEDFYVSEQVRPDSVDELESLRHWLGIDSFHIVGQCEGGVVAMDYATKYPHRLKNAVISSTMCFSSVHMSEFNAAHFLKTFEQLDPDMKAKLASWHGEKTEAFFNQFRQFGGAYGRYFFDLRPVLSLVKCPTLVLYPDRSFLFEVEQGVSFYRHLEQGELCVIPDCGHNTYDEQPEEYVSQVVNFLARHRFGNTRSKSKPVRPVTCAG
ncbi:MAG TPA: alpha/beta hydrolase [Desulfomonilaceae bacterium]|nr:alpha/beta hydrolase [Desulfomonilaceae bacterium]